MFSFHSIKPGIPVEKFALLSDILEAFPGSVFGKFISDSGMESIPVMQHGRCIGFVD